MVAQRPASARAGGCRLRVDIASLTQSLRSSVEITAVRVRPEKACGMRTVLFASTLGALVAASTLEARALPVSSSDALGAPSALTRVADDCGPGWNRDRFGYCRPQWSSNGGYYACWYVQTYYGPRRVCRQ